MEADISEIIQLLKKKTDQLFEDFVYHGNWDIDEKLLRRCLQTLEKILDYICKLVDKEKKKNSFRKSQQIDPEIAELELNLNSISEELVENVGIVKQEKEHLSSIEKDLGSPAHKTTTQSYSKQSRKIGIEADNVNSKTKSPANPGVQRRVARRKRTSHITLSDDEMVDEVVKKQRIVPPKVGLDEANIPPERMQSNPSGNNFRLSRRTRAQKIKEEKTEGVQLDEDRAQVIHGERAYCAVQTKEEETKGRIGTEVEMSIIINSGKTKAVKKPDPEDETKATEFK